MFLKKSPNKLNIYLKIKLSFLSNRKKNTNNNLKSVSYYLNVYFNINFLAKVSIKYLELSFFNIFSLSENIVLLFCFSFL